MDFATAVGLGIGLLGIGVTIGIAIWQYITGKRDRSESNNVVRSVGAEVIENVARMLASSTSETETPYGMVDSDKRLHSKFADLDGDGEDELMVQYIAGAHGSALQVFGFKDWEFRLIAELGVDTPAGFVAEDVDEDGRLEIVTGEVSPAADLPYVMGFRDEVWYRLENGQFVETNRIPNYTPDDLEQARRQLNTW